MGPVSLVILSMEKTMVAMVISELHDFQPNWHQTETHSLVADGNMAETVSSLRYKSALFTVYD